MVASAESREPVLAGGPADSCLRSLSRLLCEDLAGGEEAPDTFELVAVPRYGHARYVFPAETTSVQRAAVTGYPRLRTPRRRLSRWSMSKALERPALARLVGRSATWEAAPGSVLGALRRQFGPDLQVSARVPQPNRHRPFMLTLLDGDSHIRGFAKVSVDPRSEQALLREARALQLAQELPPFVASPRLLFQDRIGPTGVIVIAPLPPGVRRSPRGLGSAPSWPVVRAVSELGGAAGTAADYLDGLEARLAGLPARAAVRRWRARTPGVGDLTVGRWHGDLTPWNMAVEQDRVWIWDWERSTDPVPVGFDLLHHYYQVARIGLRLGVGAALQWREASRPVLRSAGLLGVAPLLLRLHEWEITAQSLSQAPVGRGRLERYGRWC